jgi:hypothetical protein
LAEKEVMAGAEAPPALKVAIWARLLEEALNVQAEETDPAALGTRSAEASSLCAEAAAARLVNPVPAEKVTRGLESFMAAVKMYSPLAEVVTGPTEMEEPLPVLFTAV